jgi:hypothetical protein
LLLTTFGFEAHYQLKQLPGSSAVGVTHVFRRQPDPEGADSISFQSTMKGRVLEVTPTGGSAWIGTFQAGAEGLDGIFATPNADAVCVIVKGQGYWVPVLAPSQFEAIRTVPIKQVIPIAERGALIFCSYTRLAMYGALGLSWVTEDLSWDGLEITGVRDATLEGTAWDSPAERRVPFSVDLDTGKACGGSSPAMYRAR